jgi:hypothetical protein
MNKSLLLFILLLLVFLESCIVQAPKNARKSFLNTNLTGTNINTGTGTSVTPLAFASDEIQPYWFDTQKIIGTMSINMNTQNSYYLRGQNIHNFLSNSNGKGGFNYQTPYCLKADFGTPLSYKVLWVRAIPLAISNFTLQATERVLRIDIPSTADNTSSCGQGTALAYDPTQICTNCFGKITSSSLLLNTVTNAIATPVPLASLSLNSVQLQIDLQSNSTSTVSLCTNSSCSAKGFDCCIEGQCVKDATQKSQASSNSQYSQAMSEYAVNPLSFINWPNIFYICSNISHSPPPIPPTIPSPTPLNSAQARVALYKTDYKCISDVQSSLGYANCTVITPALTLDPAYQSIKKKLSRSCGCTATDIDMAIKCPDWGIRPLYNSSMQIDANIVDFYCYTPAPVSQMGPITNLDVSVPNRSAPHRLYSAQGNAYDLITDMTKVLPATMQEGIAFTYVDELNKMSPFNSTFNINSVLGSMSIDLNHALPAKTVTVELGKTYILSATNGYYSPCPKCGTDNWFQNFFPFVTSQKGVGVKASGFTTARDAYSDNASLGNYEDTKFGRACFVPVTMLPFSHKKQTTLQLQRQNRLTTQAAYYINGYQRDWFGFNQGALIGSFDAVTWFAIGNGRRITATSSKLYLAINAAFVDLADKTDTTVNIVPDNPNSTVANFDFDATILNNDPKQNQGATCQRYHQCTTDTDCITQLGWEYVCADVSQYKTNWPTTDANGNEISNAETKSTLFDILGPTIDVRLASRCIYRGAGAPCKGDAVSATTTLNNLNKKIFTCAPNFYCASLNSNAFNSELVRSPNEPNGMLYGFDANVLGRPLNYVTANKSLPLEVIANIQANALSVSAVTTDIGICRPGKSLNAAFTETQRHYSNDPTKRTDYISQIANCDSNTPFTAAPAVNLNRFVNCPVIETDPTLTTYLNLKSAPTANEQVQQNSCGGESVYKPTNSLVNVSAFKLIEGLTLDKNATISSPQLAQDACLRRAGSVCNTDLDCSPNLMHEQSASTMSFAAFGGTEAEQLYWKESLICGQGATKPIGPAAAVSNYQLNQNRCCRDIGQDFTMFTSGADNGASNTTLNTAAMSYVNPSLAGRYSRYSASPTAFTTATAIPNINTAAANEPAAYQWKVIGETGSRTCCGGGFIRKFANGSHDWFVNRTRLFLDTTNFSCLNFRSPLADKLPVFSDAKIRQGSFSAEWNLFCTYPQKDPLPSGCLQIPYRTDPSATEFSLIAPKQYGVPGVAGIAMGTLNTTLVDPATPANWLVGGFAQNNVNAPYQPTNVRNLGNYMSDTVFYFGTSFYLPAYIIPANIKAVKLHYFDATNAPKSTSDITALNKTAVMTGLSGFACSTVTADTYSRIVETAPVVANASNALEGYCLDTTNPSRPIMHIKATNDPLGTKKDVQTWAFASVEINFYTIEQSNNTIVAEPGNRNYYLTKLGRLELLGIPQITYEPLYCNNDQNNVVPGIFLSGVQSLKTRANFAANITTSYSAAADPMQSYTTDVIPAGQQDITAGIGNVEKKFTYQNKIDHAAIFSAKDFTCCTPLGLTPKNGTASGCCSGFATTAATGSPICKLPIGADLNVYFNRFVSNEGVGNALPGSGGVVGFVDSIVEPDTDFNKFTGEPKLRASTADKVYALGLVYCDRPVVTTGSAFGIYAPQPNQGFFKGDPASPFTPADYPLSIIDDVADSLGGYKSKAGFDFGMHWNHHYYCGQ